MMLKTENGYFDFRADVEIEEQSKIFEDLDAMYGDFSYSFEMPWTSNNLKLLGLPYPDVSNKSIYQQVLVDLLDNDGELLKKGLLRVESVEFKRFISCSFFSGNYNWMNEITGLVSDLYFEEYNGDLSEANIQAYTSNTEGVTFPIIDFGGLITRSGPYLKTEDFIPCMYVKTIFKKIFTKSGIKIKGDLLNDYIYNNAIIVKSISNSEQIQNRSSYANKILDQIITDGVLTKINITDDSTDPFFDGSTNNYSTVNSRYTADKKMQVQVDYNLIVTTPAGTNVVAAYIYKNGATALKAAYVVQTGDVTVNVSGIFVLEAGDYIEPFNTNFNFFTGANATARSGTTIKITPVLVYNFLGQELVPKWTKQDFVSNFLNILNVIPHYEPATKTLTLDIFEKIKSKDYVDASQYIKVDQANYSEFINNYGKKSIFTYDESEEEELKKYNVGQFIRYGEGYIQVNNDFIDETAEVVSTDFKAPISYVNGSFGASIERVNILELEEEDSTDFTGVTDSSGEAQFDGINNIANDGDLVRVSDSDVSSYNGDWIAYSTGSGSMKLRGVGYISNAIGTITKLSYKYTNSDDVYLFINIPSISAASFSSRSQITLNSTLYTNYSYAYFNLLNIGKAVNTNYKQSLSFGSVNNPLNYQRSILDTYWSNVDDILNDPVKLIVTAYIPKSVYQSLIPLNPVFIKSNETTNLYYVNRKSGYISQSVPCTIELIKL